MASRFAYSKSSLQKLETVDPKLQDVARLALALSPIDIKILEGARTDERQDRLFLEGATTKRAGQSKHNTGPVSGRNLAAAIDWAPYPIDWDDTERFVVVAGVFYVAAGILGVDIRWGGDWDEDWSTKDESFRDYGHVELG